MGRAEWGPLPTSPLPTTEYPKCIHLRGWQTAVSWFLFPSAFSACFLVITPAYLLSLFPKTTDIAAHFRLWLSFSHDGAALSCHPGLA